MPVTATALLNRLRSRLKLRHLEALIALDELRNMGRAAKTLGVTQPALSHLLADMERLLETQLFLRHAKGVDPTQVAKEIIPIARRIMAATEECAERIAINQKRETGLVRVGSIAAASGALLSHALPDFAQRHPEIQVQVSTIVATSVDAIFADGEFDVICCRDRNVLPSEWSFVPCVKDELVPICSPRHPLAGREDVSLDELGQQVWLQNHISTVARRRFDELVERQGWKEVRKVHILSQNSMLVASMLRQDTCITLVPRSVLAPWLSDGLLYEIPAGLQLMLPPLGYIWRPAYAGPATQSLAATLSAPARRFENAC